MVRNTALFFIILILSILFTITKNLNAQGTPGNTIKAVILDKSTNKPLPGANIFLQSDPFTGTSAGVDGEFTLQLHSPATDSLIISFVGFKEKVIGATDAIQKGKIYLEPKAQKIEKAVITGKRIIAEEFTIKQMKQLDIYLNPTAKADPVLAINSMPASTTTDESATISLRGSSPAETGIFFNDVPIYDAVRFSQLDGIGTFSIFNTAIVERMHVFPSNPPLEYGNASSGLIAIESQNKIPETSQNSLSLSLANVGAQISRRLSPNTGLNIFSNYQPSAGLIGVNETALDELNNFFSGDLGIHAIHKISDSMRVKFFNYSNIEGYSYDYRHPSFNGELDQGKKRNFSVFNFLSDTKYGEFTFNSGLSLSNEKYAYGNTSIDMDKRDIYLNANHHLYAGKFSVKTGISFDSRYQQMDGTFPVFDYALGKSYPSTDVEDSRNLDLTEIFTYGKYEFNENWITGLGIRKNIPSEGMEDYFSGQWNLNYTFLSDHSLNFSLGRYHNYALPNAELDDVTLFRSDQVSLDYKLENSDIELTAAVFAKNTEFNEIKEEVKGAEIFSKVYLFKNKLRLQGSYTFIDAKRKNDNITYSSDYDLNYYVRGSVKYQHSSNLDISLILLYREGTFFHPVTSREYINSLDVYKPMHSDMNNRTRLPDYLKLDISTSKVWPVSENLSVVTFFNVSNLLNYENVRGKAYNFNYTETSELYYSKRTIYFGGMIYF